MSAPADRDGAPLASVDAEDACQRGYAENDDQGMTDRENLLDHLEETMTLGHGFRFEPWRDTLPMEALLSIHDSHHQAEANHPEGFHSHEREIP